MSPAPFPTTHKSREEYDVHKQRKNNHTGEEYQPYQTGRLPSRRLRRTFIHFVTQVSRTLLQHCCSNPGHLQCMQSSLSLQLGHDWLSAAVPRSGCRAASLQYRAEDGNKCRRCRLHMSRHSCLQRVGPASNMKVKRCRKN